MYSLQVDGVKCNQFLHQNGCVTLTCLWHTTTAPPTMAHIDFSENQTDKERTSEQTESLNLFEGFEDTVSRSSRLWWVSLWLSVMNGFTTRFPITRLP